MEIQARLSAIKRMPVKQKPGTVREAVRKDELPENNKSCWKSEADREKRQAVQDLPSAAGFSAGILAYKHLISAESAGFFFHFSVAWRLQDGQDVVQYDRNNVFFDG